VQSRPEYQAKSLHGSFPENRGGDFRRADSSAADQRQQIQWQGKLALDRKNETFLVDLELNLERPILAAVVYYDRRGAAPRSS